MRSILLIGWLMIVSFLSVEAQSKTELLDANQAGRYLSLKSCIIEPETNMMEYRVSSRFGSYGAPRVPFFCRLEKKLEETSKINTRFRLGSLDYVNQLEGK